MVSLTGSSPVFGKVNIMDNILVLLEKYFNVVESLILSEILTESEIFDILNKLNVKIDADLKKQFNQKNTLITIRQNSRKLFLIQCL